MGMVEYRKRALVVLNNERKNEIPKFLRVSDNGKTGVSINLSIVDSCQPTKECMSYCYGMRGPIGYSNSINAQSANFRRFEYLETAPLSEVDGDIAIIIEALRKSKQNWIRWNGVGDLIPGSVRVITRMAELHPNITQWIVTRKVDQASMLPEVKAIKILFSLDSSTPDTILQRAKELKKTYKRAKFRFSWTRRDANAVPRHVSIIFNEHIGRRKGNWLDKRVCEATLPNKNHDSSCNTCRRCFN